MPAWKVLVGLAARSLTAPKAAALLGLTGGLAALLGCLAGGPIINAVRRRGCSEAPLRVGLAASVIYTMLAAVGFLAPPPVVAVIALALASFWGYMPSVAIYAAMADVLPAGARGRFAGFNTLCSGDRGHLMGPGCAPPIVHGKAYGWHIGGGRLAPKRYQPTTRLRDLRWLEANVLVRIFGSGQCVLPVRPLPPTRWSKLTTAHVLRPAMF